MILQPTNTETGQFFKLSPTTHTHMEGDHGRGPYDPIGGTAKQKAGLTVRKDKAIIQDAHDIYKCTNETEETSSIKFTFLLTQEY